MSDEKPISETKQDSSRLDELRAKLEELMKSRDLSESKPREKIEDIDHETEEKINEYTQKSDRTLLSLTARLESRIRAIENSLGELQSKTDALGGRPQVDVYKIRLTQIESKLSELEKRGTGSAAEVQDEVRQLERQLELAKKEGTVRTERLQHWVESDIKPWIVKLESRIQDIYQNSNDSFNSVKNSWDVRIRQYEKNANDLLTRTWDTVSSIQKKVDQEVSRLKDVISESQQAGIQSDASIKALENQMQAKLGRIEKHLEDVQTHSLETVARLEGDLQSAYNQLDSRYREVLNRAKEPAAELEVKFTEDLMRLQESVKLLEQQSAQIVKSVSEEVRMRVHGIVDKINEIDGSQVSQYAKFQEESIARILQIENRFNDLLEKSSEPVATLRQELQSEIDRVKGNIDEIVKIQSDSLQYIKEDVSLRISDVLRKMDAVGVQAHNAAQEIEGSVLSRIHQLESRQKEILDIAREPIGGLEEKVNQEFQYLRGEMKDIGAKTIDVIRGIEGDIRAKIASLSRRQEETSQSRADEYSKFQQEVQSQLVQLESRHKELVTRAWKPIVEVEGKIDNEVQKVRLEFQQMISGHAEQLRTFQDDLSSRISGISKRLEEVGIHNLQQVSKSENDLEARFKLYESLQKDWMAKNVEPVVLFKGKVEGELLRLQQELAEIGSQNSQTVRLLENQLTVKIQVAEEKIEKLIEKTRDSEARAVELVEERIASFEKNNRKLISGAWESITSLEKKIDAEMFGFKDGVAGIGPKISESVRVIEKDLTGKVYRLDAKIDVLAGQIQETLAGVKKQLEGKAYELDGRGEEFLKNAQALMDQMRARGDADMVDFRQRMAEMEQRLSKSESLTEKAILSQVMEDEAWQKLNQKSAQAASDLEAKLRQSIFTLERQQSKIVLGKISQGFVLFTLMAMAGLGAIYGLMVYESKNHMRNVIEERFSDERIEKLVLETASKKVPALVEGELAPVVALFKNQAEQKINELESFVQQRRSQVQEDQLMFSSELAFIEQKNQISRLEDDVIKSGSRAAYEKLLAFQKNPPLPQLSESVGAALARIQNYYEQSLSSQRYSMTYMGPSNFEYRDESIPLNALFSILRHDADPARRAKAADLLRSWKNQGVPEVLLEAARKDTHLLVVRNAIRSFASVTGFRASNALDYSTASQWWESSQKTVTQNLKAAS